MSTKGAVEALAERITICAELPEPGNQTSEDDGDGPGQDGRARQQRMPLAHVGTPARRRSRETTNCKVLSQRARGHWWHVPCNSRQPMPRLAFEAPVTSPIDERHNRGLRRLPALWIAISLVACGGVTVDRSGNQGTGGASTDAGSGGSSSGGITSGAGGENSGGSNPGSGGHQPGTGGMSPSAGGGAPLPDCPQPVTSGTPCSAPSAHCGGPCSNSWQAENVCQGGTWQSLRVVACGPDASHAPQCHNSFSGGSLTPCCAAGGLDCHDKPDGYPDFGCTPGDMSFCACSCQGGTQICGC